MKKLLIRSYSSAEPIFLDITAELEELLMNKPEFKLLPCVFCTLGYNTYVAGYHLVNKASKLFTQHTANIDLNNAKFVAVDDLSINATCVNKDAKTTQN